jgi:DNA-directed RNA polymerase specialized sigma24 family protein
MLGANEQMKREDLFQEILDSVREWPKRDQWIFAQSHYHGRSLKMISISLHLDAEEVRVVLQHCNRELYAKLRKFRESEYGKSPFDIIRAAASITCKSVPGGCNF